MAIIGHCESMRFRFAVLDSAKGSSNPAALDPRTTHHRHQLRGVLLPVAAASSDPASGARKIVPPGGHMLGVFARTDVERGVFKAPANEIVRGALDLEYDINDGHQETLNPRGVNAIRALPRPRHPHLGLPHAVLERAVEIRERAAPVHLPRALDLRGHAVGGVRAQRPKLWARVSDTIRLFLRTQWREGALFGRKEEEAFFITCDETTMTRDDILNGRLICEIGIAPVRPAEFVIFRIFQNTAEAQR